MQLKTILNRVEYFKSFVYGKAQWVEDAPWPTTEVQIEVRTEARQNGRPICSGCGQVRAGYDRLPERRFEFVPLWAIAVYFVYAMRRMDCPTCGVKVEKVPWCDGKNITRGVQATESEVPDFLRMHPGRVLHLDHRPNLRSNVRQDGFHVGFGCGLDSLGFPGV